MLNTIIDLETITLAPAQSAKNLTVLPLRSPGTPQSSYRTLDEALSAGIAQVTEVSEAGSVPELRFVNLGDRPVLLLDGEELIGAKQNRVLNLTILADARSAIVIPVSCVEHGRWARRSHTFESADHSLYAKARRRKVEQVSHSLRTSSRRLSDQADIWNDIAAKSARMRSSSRTGAASAMFQRTADELNAFVAMIETAPDQTGAMFFIDGRFVGIELFGSSDGFARLFPKLLRSYGLDALDETRWSLPPAATSAAAAESYLADLGRASLERHKSVGLGEDIRFETPQLVGAALFNAGALIHLSAFARSYG